MSRFEELVRAVALLPPGASVILVREQFLDAVAAPNAARTSADVCTPAPPADLTAADIAERFHRSSSTVRGWLEAGRFPGAYKLRGRDWRIPLAALEAFREHELHPTQPAVASDLGAWRRVRPAGAAVAPQPHHKGRA